MDFSFYTVDRVSGAISLRFWFRATISLLIAIEVFWHTSGFASDFKALFFQPVAFVKLSFLSLGALLVMEWIYRSIRWLARREGIFPMDWKLGWKLVFMGLVVPFVFLFIWGAVFSIAFGKEMAGFASAVSLVMILMILVSVGLTCVLLHPPVIQEEITFKPVEVLKVEVFYGGVKVNLLAADIAYVFYRDGVYYLTSHAGVCYETSLAEDFHEFYALLDPDRFFMINDFTIVSRKAVKDIEENEDGTIKVNLNPKPIMPKAFKEEDSAPGVFDFLNWN